MPRIWTLVSLSLAAAACTPSPNYAPTPELCASEDDCGGALCTDGMCADSDPICDGDDCPDSCGDCAEWQICSLGQCFDADPCYGVTCDFNEVCNDGSCVVAEDSCVTQHIECPDGYGCVRGVCEPDRCDGVSCGEGRYCLHGRCVLDRDCEGQACSPCMSDEMCDLGQVCRPRGDLTGPRYCRGHAPTSNLGEVCAADDACGDDACVEGVCRPRCNESQDCGEGLVCELREGNTLRGCVPRDLSTCPDGCGDAYCHNGQCVTACTLGGECPGDCRVVGVENAFDGNQCSPGPAICPDHTLRVINEPEIFCVASNHCSLDAHCEDGTTCLDARDLGADESAYLGVCGFRVR